MTVSSEPSATAACRACPLKNRRLCRDVQAFVDAEGWRGARRMRVVSAETCLQDENERPKVVGILRSGYLRTERILPDGRRSVLSLFAPGDLIGDLSGMARGPALVAATDAEICALDPLAIRRAMQQGTRLYTRFVAEVARQHARQLEFVWRRGALDSRERVLAFIVLATEFMPVERLADGSVILSIPLSRKDWADFANTTVETISRTLTALARRKMVKTVAPGRYHIRSVAALAKLAGLDCGEDCGAMALVEAEPRRQPDRTGPSTVVVPMPRRQTAPACRSA